MVRAGGAAPPSEGPQPSDLAVDLHAKMVRVAGFEPAAPRSQTECSGQAELHPHEIGRPGTGSNLRPSLCKSDTLPSELRGDVDGMVAGPRVELGFTGLWGRAGSQPPCTDGFSDDAYNRSSMRSLWTPHSRISWFELCDRHGARLMPRKNRNVKPRQAQKRQKVRQPTRGP